MLYRRIEHPRLVDAKKTGLFMFFWHKMNGMNGGKDEVYR
jgi:hypothetical protein